MGKGIFRCVLIVAILVLFGTATYANSYGLVDTYNLLIARGWNVKDALGFLAASLAGTLALNPGIAPAVAAGALSAYIAVNVGRLYDLYREWRNTRTGIALLNPVSVSAVGNVKPLRSGEYGWTYMRVSLSRQWNGLWYFVFGYTESLNDSGKIKANPNGFTTSGTVSKESVISNINEVLRTRVPNFMDQEGITMFVNFLQTAYSNVLSNNNFSVLYTREVVPALEVDSGYDAALGYTVNVDPNSISEEGVQYLNDPDAFYNWFINNYLNGVNQGTYVTPLDTAYDKIRSDLQKIIEKLNSLVTSGGGISEETINVLKTEIVNAMNTKVGSLDSRIKGLEDGIDSRIKGLEDVINNNFYALQNAIDSKLENIENYVTSMTTVINNLSETQQQEQGLLERLLEWLDNTLWEKLREFFSGEWFEDLLVRLFRLLVLPEDASDIWNNTVSGWMEKVKWDDIQMPSFSISGSSLGSYSIPLGNGSIGLDIRGYVEMMGLRDLITTVIVFSMWFGFVLKLLPRFHI